MYAPKLNKFAPKLTLYTFRIPYLKLKKEFLLKLLLKEGQTDR